jgi:hypothetical protein
MGLALKTGITLTVTPQMDRMLQAAQAAYAEVMGEAFPVVVTSGNDGKHMKGSLHYKDAALDVRTGHTWEPPLMTADEATMIRDDLSERLGPSYDVVLEKDHLHLEHDSKSGGAT